MTAAEVRSMVQTVVEAHATHNTFYSIWSDVKDRPTELTYPCAIWDQWNGRMVEDSNGFMHRVQLVRLLVITSLGTDRSPAQRDTAVEEADNAAGEFILKIKQDYPLAEVDNVQITTQFDEYTALETGVLLSFTVKGNAECLGGSEFPGGECPTLGELIAANNWATIKGEMSEGQVSDATADLCDDCDTEFTLVVNVNGVEVVNGTYDSAVDNTINVN